MIRWIVALSVYAGMIGHLTAAYLLFDPNVGDSGGYWIYEVHGDTVEIGGGSPQYILGDGTSIHAPTGIDAPRGPQEIRGAFVVPATIEGKPVTTIGDHAFYGGFEITSITIPDSVTKIGCSAFEGCVKLKNVNIPEGVTSIGDRAFDYCKSLKTMPLPNSITNIGVDAFSYCERLECISIPGDLTIIEDGMFNGCGNLASVVIPDSVGSIGNYAFFGCGSLKSMTLPNSITNIGIDVFRECAQLESINIPSALKVIPVGAFMECYALPNITFPDGLTCIGEDAFRSCASLTSVTIPDSCTDIYDRAFAESGLTSLQIPNTVTRIREGAFYKCGALTSVTIPDSVTAIDGHAFDGCNRLANIDIPASVREIGAYAFFSCDGLSSLTIPDSVKEIGECAFFSCDGLSSLTIPDSVTSIGGQAFGWCGGLTSVTISSDIAYAMFFNCKKLASVDVRNPVKDIGVKAFYGCECLTSVTLPNSVTNIDEKVFNECYKLESINIPDSVVHIGDQAFYGTKAGRPLANAPGVREVDGWVVYQNEWDAVLPHNLDLSGIRGIADAVFLGCSELEGVTFNDALKYIGTSAFIGCSSLKSLTLPSSVRSIGSYAFAECGFRNLSIPDSLAIIESGTFAGCANLAHVTIPDSITNIGSNAFGCCSCLTSLVIPSSVRSIGAEAFAGCMELETITIPASVQTIGSRAFAECRWLEHVVFEGCPDMIAKDAFLNTMYANPLGFVIEKGVLQEVTGWLPRRPLEIPAGVAAISHSAFLNCHQDLMDVVLPDSIVSIEEMAFASCFNLKSVTIPNAVTEIGAGAFAACSALTNVVFGSCNVTTIKDGTFDGCVALVHVEIPVSVTNIGAHAFGGCSKLGSVRIPDSVTAIARDAFTECFSLFDNDSVPGLSLVDGWVVDVNWYLDEDQRAAITKLDMSAARGMVSPLSGMGMFIGLDEVILPEIMTSFESTDGIAPISLSGADLTVVFPAALERMDVTALLGLSGVRNLVFNGNAPILHYDEELYPCGVELSQLMTGVIYVSRNASGWGIVPGTWNGISIQYRGEARYIVESGVLHGVEMNGEKKMVIPDTVTSLEWDSFIDQSTYNYPSKLEKVTIPDSVTNVSRDAFAPFVRMLLGYEEGNCDKIFDRLTIPGLLLVDGWVVGIDETYADIAHVKTLNLSAVRGIAAQLELPFPLEKLILPSSMTRFELISDMPPFFASAVGVVFPASLEHMDVAALAGLAYVQNVEFLGNAPTVCDEMVMCPYGIDLSMMFSGKVFVSRKSSGWGVPIPGTWNGVPIRYSGEPMFVVESGELQGVELNGVTDLIIPDSVVSIGQMAFVDPGTMEFVSGVKHIKIPDSVKKVSADAFMGMAIPTSVPSGVDDVIDKTSFPGALAVDGWVVASDMSMESTRLAELQSIATLDLSGARGIATGMMIDGMTVMPNLREIVLPESMAEIVLQEGAMGTPTSMPFYLFTTNSVRIVFPAGFLRLDVDWLKLLGCSLELAFKCRAPELVYDRNLYPDGIEDLSSMLPVNKILVNHDSTGWGTVPGMWYGIRIEFLDEIPADGEMPTVLDDPDATVAGDAESGFVIKSIAATGAVEVMIPDGIDAAKVTVEVRPDVRTVKPNGANIKVVKTVENVAYDITPFLDIPVANANGVIDLTKAGVRAVIVNEALDTSKGAEVNLGDTTKPILKTSATKPGLTYTLREGVTLETMVDGATKVGDGEPWTPPVTVKGGRSGFYTIGVGK